MKRIQIVTGHYGSGKTEFALALALSKNLCYNKKKIVDLDIVNPYFRTNDAATYLKENGVDVIASDYASTNVDVPALPASVISVFDDKETFAVLDVGGDDEGATVLGRYHDFITAQDYERYLVVNTKRPLTATVEEILEQKEQIEYSSRLRITKLVNNTNLSYETSVSDLLEGQKIVQQAADKCGLPIGFICGKQEILEKLPAEMQTPRLTLNLQMKLPFMQDM